MMNHELTGRCSAGGVEGVLVVVGGGREADGRGVEAPGGSAAAEGAGAEVGGIWCRGAVAPVVRVVETVLTHACNKENE